MGEAKASEGIKGQKIEESKADKVHQGTLLRKGYAIDHAKKADSKQNMMFGFQATVDNVHEDVPSRGGIGERGGDRAEGGGRRQNAKQALKVTDDDFPTL